MKRIRKKKIYPHEDIIYKKYFPWTCFLFFDKIKDKYSEQMFEAVRKNKYLYSHSQDKIEDIEKLMDLCLKMCILISGEMSICVSEKEEFISINIKEKDLQMSGKELLYLSKIAMASSNITFIEDPKGIQMMVMYEFSDENPPERSHSFDTFSAGEG